MAEEKGASSGLPQQGKKEPPFLRSGRGMGQLGGSELCPCWPEQRSKKKQCLHPGTGLVMVPSLLGSKRHGHSLSRLSPSFNLLVAGCILQGGVAIS